MNQKILILVGGLLVGAGVVYLIPKGKSPNAEPSVSVPDAGISAPEVKPAPVAPPVHKEDVATRSRVQPLTIAPAASAWSKLSEKYGVEKTALSGKITSNLTSVINQGLELAKTAARNSGSGSIAEAASKEALRNASGQLELSDDQQKQAGAVIQAAVEKRMNAVTDLTAAMGSEPEQIMGMLLAGDSLARKEISQEEYDQLTKPTRTMLQNLVGFVGGRGAAGQLLSDPETTAQLNAILTPDQQTKLADMATKWQQDMQTMADNQSKNGFPFQPGQIPVMPLDQLDQSVSAVKQMADAAKQMMDAMKSMKDANATPK